MNIFKIIVPSIVFYITDVSVHTNRFHMNLNDDNPNTYIHVDIFEKKEKYNIKYRFGKITDNS